jgi:hypothetical protein
MEIKYNVRAQEAAQIISMAVEAINPYNFPGVNLDDRREVLAAAGAVLSDMDLNDPRAWVRGVLMTMRTSELATMRERVADLYLGRRD